MRNPLNKRIPHELKQDFGKYFVIFAFLVLLIGLVSGFLVASDSMMVAYDEGFDKYNVENGHITFDKALPEELLAEFEQDGYVSLHELFYKNVSDENGSNIRIYKNRESVNRACLMKGELPDKEDEIAIDRLFADNNGLKVGNTIKVNDKTLTISGFVALPDYSALFEDSADMMLNASGFSIAVMTGEGFDSFDNVATNYNYAWLYGEKVDRNDDKLNKELADAMLSAGQDILTEYDTKLIAQGRMDEVISVVDYLPQYMNQAINFAREDIGKDSAMFLVFAYIVIVVICFVFAVTISNTIQEESGVIGTLRASGFSRAELIRHYMTLPVLVTVVGALVGNILGYTWLKDVMADMYYNSYSLSTFTTLWNAGAFVKTTVIPMILMFIINWYVLAKKMKHKPICFLRHDLTKHKNKKAIRLNTKLPFMNRFRLRVLFQNIPNYVTLFFGVFLGGVIVVFSLMFPPLLDSYKETILEQRICDYQYILADTTIETANANAEKFSMTSLHTTDKEFLEEEVSIYGITADSKYVPAAMESDSVVISSAYAKKYNLSKGDTIELLDTFTDKKYEFTVGGTYTYDAGIAVFMDADRFNTCFEKPEGSFTGYFSNEKLDDIPDIAVAKIVTISDLTKVSDQLTDSLGSFMGLLKFFGIAMFLLLMYLLSKQVIEKNANSISMSKILGFYNGEIGSVYIVATSLVIACSLLITIPLVHIALRVIFLRMLYTMLTGYIPFDIHVSCYVQMFIFGAVCYAFIAVLQMVKISKVNKADALKNVE